MENLESISEPGWIVVLLDSIAEQATSEQLLLDLVMPTETIQ